MVEQFEQLTMSGAPGREGVDMVSLPRPVGEYQERALAAPPPYDAFNCSPDNMRMTVNAVPVSTALKARWPLPLGAIVQPMADESKGRQVPVVSLGSAGIIRCKRCRTYMNPFMTWTDGGRKYKCNVCHVHNDIPGEYFSHLDHEGRRCDVEQRPELAGGTVEYIAPAEYMVRPPMPPVYFFAIDVSYAAVSSGLLHSVSTTVKECLDKLPGEGRAMVGFITFDSTLHFYNLKASLSAPQMMVVAELDEPFLPLPDDLLVNAADSRGVLDALLTSLPATFASNSVVDSAMGPALQAAFHVMQHVGGKLLLFQAAVPSLGIGKVKNREVLSAYGTDRESTLRQPDDPFFKRFAAECSRVQISLNVFSCSAGHMDLASLAAVPRYTCGDLYHYPGFQSGRDGVKLSAELRHNLLRTTAWEAVMRIRCSEGLRIASFHGHFFNRSSDLLALPTCDPDKSFAVQVAHKEGVVGTAVAYVQCALLYTSSQGERRIRVHTLSVPVVQDLSDMFRAADGTACAALLAKLGVEKSLSARLDESRAMVQQKVMLTFKEFKLLNASLLRGSNKLAYPESLRYLPIYCLGVVKSAALRGGAKDVNPDERMAVGYDMMSAPVAALARAAYPDLYPLHETGGDWGMEGPDGAIVLPQTVALSGAYLDERGVFLLDNGRVFILWLGRMLHTGWGQDVFGVDLNSAGAQDSTQLSVEPERPGSTLSSRVNKLLAALRASRPLYQQCFVVRQGSPLEMHVAQYFVEDRGPAVPSYPDWMLSIYKGVMAK
ncbi:COP-II coat subunit [Haematococcus lacustris]